MNCGSPGAQKYRETPVAAPIRPRPAVVAYVPPRGSARSGGWGMLALVALAVGFGMFRGASSGSARVTAVPAYKTVSIDMRKYDEMQKRVREAEESLKRVRWPDRTDWSRVEFTAEQRRALERLRTGGIHEAR